MTLAEHTRHQPVAPDQSPGSSSSSPSPSPSPSPVPVVVVVEPEPDLRSHLVRVLGPGVSSVASAATLQSLMTTGGPHPVGEPGPSGDAPVTVVVTGPSIPLPEAVATLSMADTMGPPARRGRVAVVGVTRRCTTAALTNALGAGLSDLIGIDAAPDQLRHAVRRTGLTLVGHHLLAGSGPTAVGRASAGTTNGGATTAGGSIAVFAPKGGAGASTVAVNVAVGLAARSTVGCDGAWTHPTVLIDADLQFGDQALMLGIDPVCSLASLTAGGSLSVDGIPTTSPKHGFGGADVDAAVFERLLLAHRHSGLALLGAPVDPALADTVPAGLVTAAIEAIGSMAPWVVVDLPSHIGDLTLEVIDDSSHLLVVTGTDPTSVKDSRITADTLRRLGVPTSRWTLICNGVDSAGGLSVAQIEQHVEVAAGALIPWDAAIPESLLRGNPAVLEFPGCAASLALMDVVDQLVGVSRPVGMHPPGVTRPGQVAQLGQRVVTAVQTAMAQARR